MLVIHRVARQPHAPPCVLLRTFSTSEKRTVPQMLGQGFRAIRQDFGNMQSRFLFFRQAIRNTFYCAWIRTFDSSFNTTALLEQAKGDYETAINLWFRRDWTALSKVVSSEALLGMRKAMQTLNQQGYHIRLREGVAPVKIQSAVIQQVAMDSANSPRPKADVPLPVRPHIAIRFQAREQYDIVDAQGEPAEIAMRLWCAPDKNNIRRSLFRCQQQLSLADVTKGNSVNALRLIGLDLTPSVTKIKWEMLPVVELEVKQLFDMVAHMEKRNAERMAARKAKADKAAAAAAAAAAAKGKDSK